MHTNKQGFEDRILRDPRVVELTGLSRSTRARLVRDGQFPRPVRLSGSAVGWRESEILHWIRERQPA